MGEEATGGKSPWVRIAGGAVVLILGILILNGFVLRGELLEEHSLAVENLPHTVQVDLSAGDELLVEWESDNPVRSTVMVVMPSGEELQADDPQQTTGKRFLRKRATSEGTHRVTLDLPQQAGVAGAMSLRVYLNDRRPGAFLNWL